MTQTDSNSPPKIEEALSFLGIAAIARNPFVQTLVKIALCIAFGGSFEGQMPVAVVVLRLACIGVVAAVGTRGRPMPVIDQFWSPVLNSASSVSHCVAEWPVSE